MTGERLLDPSVHPGGDPAAAAGGRSARWPAVLTWQGVDAPRMESARVLITERGLKAVGRIVGGDCAAHPAFSASYDLLLDDAGVTRRLSMRSVVARGERQMSLSRNAEGFWLVDHGQGPHRAEFDGALDVDVLLSPMFNALAVRRLGLHVRDQDTPVPMVYVGLPDLGVAAAEHRYTSVAGRITVASPAGTFAITADADGFVEHYDGLATRI